jgi:hypothetical protein
MITLELILILNCIGSTPACSKSLEAYYTYDTHLTRKVNSAKIELKDYYKANPYMQIIAPPLGFILKEEAIFKLNKDWSLKASKDFTGPIYSIEF